MAAGRPREFDYDKALEQAMHVFWKKGYEGTSMPDLTDAMGMNRPSIYASFGNKEELFRKALERYELNSHAFFREALSAPKVRDALERFLFGAAKSFSCDETPSGCLAVQSALVGSDEAQSVRLEAQDRRERINTIVAERLEKAKADGELPADVNVQEMARFYTAVLHGMAVQSAGGVSNADLMAVAHTSLKALPV